MEQAFSFGNLDDVSEQPDKLPNGVYTLRSVEQTMKDTKTGGSLLAAQFEVVDGPGKGRRIFQNFNLVNPNEKAVEIALRDLKAWIIACGLPATGALTMPIIDGLEGKTFAAKVGVEKDKTGQYDDRNKIVRFLKPKTDGGAPAAPAAPSAAAPAAPAAAQAKPWE